MTVTPDGHRYLTLTETRVPRPFHFRWLIPTICRQSPLRWKVSTYLSVAALAPLAWWYTGSPWMAVCVWLPGIQFNWRHPVLVDAPGMALALLAAVLWPVCWPVAVAVVLVAGMVRETAPVWSAVYAWNPLLLVGLVPVAIRALQRPGPDPCGRDADLAHPIRSSVAAHRNRWLDPYAMVTPWGPLVVSVLALTPQLAVALAAGYAQLLVATDSVRLFQWAWPPVALAVVHVAPAWLPLIAVGIVFNPWKGDGL